MSDDRIPTKSIPDPAIVPGILPPNPRTGGDDLPPEADPHFGNEDAQEDRKDSTSDD